MGAIQCTLRHGAGDCFSGLDSFRVVKSTFNQVISFIDLKSDGIRWSFIMRTLNVTCRFELNDLFKILFGYDMTEDRSMVEYV